MPLRLIIQVMSGRRVTGDGAVVTMSGSADIGVAAVEVLEVALRTRTQPKEGSRGTNTVTARESGTGRSRSPLFCTYEAVQARGLIQYFLTRFSREVLALAKSGRQF